MHKWSKWMLSHAHGYTIFQRRRCLRCGLYSQRVLGVGDKNDLSSIGEIDITPVKDIVRN
jgi:hypothetical protein